MAATTHLQNEDSRKLLDIIDELKLLPSISHDIALPQIVVVGQQSSGKSSVLKAISNINFPTNSGFCTQFATEIICRREAVESTRAQIVPDTEIDNQYRARLDAFAKQWSQISPEQDVSEIIESAKDVMGLNDYQRISKDKLRLEFSGPCQDHISLIDLPGLFEQELPGQRKNDKKLVDEMVKEYISGSQTIVLAVVSGAYDVQVQRIFRMFEPFRDRTMGIITAPDLVENGTVRAATFSQLVSNSSFKAGHGWHVLRNLSHREEQEGRDRDTVEKQFFEDRTSALSNVWATVPEARVGIQNLKSKLASLLQSSIATGLPQIQRQLRTALRVSEDELKLLGDERVTSEQQRDYVAEKSELLRELTTRELNGGGSQRSLRSTIRDANDLFAEEMINRGPYWQFVSEGPRAPRSNRQTENDGPITMAVEEWKTLMLQEISSSRGRELDGLVDPLWVGRMFLRQSRKWRSIADCHIEKTFAIVERYFHETVEQVVGAEDADRFLFHVIQPELERRNKALERKVLEILKPYSNENIGTLNRHFRSEETDLSDHLTPGPNKKAWTSNMITYYTNLMLRYYDVALNVFLDNMQNLAIENVLLGGLEDIMTATKAHKMSETDLAALASESEEITQRRLLLTTRIRDYERGSKIISKYSLKTPRSVPNELPLAGSPPRATPSTTTAPRIVVATTPSPVHVPSSYQASAGDFVTQSLPELKTPERHGRRLSKSGSSRGSSVVSRASSEEGKISSSAETTPEKPVARGKMPRRNLFAQVEDVEDESEL